MNALFMHACFFYLLVSENLDDMLLCELILQTAHLLGLHGVLILRTSVQRTNIHSNMSR